MADALVTYATKNGSTAEVAEAIGEALRRQGLTVTVAAASRVRDAVDRYDLIILGGAIYSGRWHSAAHRFLRRHRRELDTPPVAVFGMGPRTDTEDAWSASRAQLDRALGKRPWFHPVTVTVFGGVDPANKKKDRDLRDWDAIAAWAETVAEQRTKS
jgi:menaquinone-dependent protoporphyrinogen oxidase